MARTTHRRDARRRERITRREAKRWTPAPEPVA